MTQSVLTTCFPTYGLLQGCPEVPRDGFRGVSKGSESVPFFWSRLRNVYMIRFESYGGSKLDEIGPDDLFCYIRLLQGHPEASSDGFRGVSEGSETVPFLKKVLEWLYDSFWIIWRLEIGWNRSRRLVLLHTASPRPSRGVQWWFQRGFRGVWNRPFFKKRFRNGSMIRFESYGGSKLDEIGPDDLCGYIRLLQGHPEASSDGFRRVSEGSETVSFQKGFRGVWQVRNWQKRPRRRFRKTRVFLEIYAFFLGCICHHLRFFKAILGHVGTTFVGCEVPCWASVGCVVFLLFRLLSFNSFSHHFLLRNLPIPFRI